MNQINHILSIIAICFACGYAFNIVELGDKFCATTVTDEVLAKCEKCDQFVPQQMRDGITKCLTDMKKGTTFKDFRNVVCDASLRNAFFDCNMKNMKEAKKAGSAPPDESAFKQHTDCMKKALGA